MDSKLKNATPTKKPEKSKEMPASAIQLRPSAGSGWWLSCLLVVAYLINCWKYERSATFEYKFSTIIAFGLLLQTEDIHFSPKVSNRVIRWILHLTPSVATSALLFWVLQQGIIFSAFSGFATMVIYRGLFIFALQKMPKSFTHGEASIVLQGFVIFLTNLYFKLVNILQKTSECLNNTNSLICSVHSNSVWTQNHEHLSEMEKLSTVLQIGLSGVLFIVTMTYFVKLFRGVAFYALAAVTTLAVALFPIEDQLAIVILVEFLTEDLQRLCMISLYIGLLGLTVATVVWQVNRNVKSNTRTRKIFHILIVLVFVPGLIFQCAFLFVASGVALALLIILETMRVIKLQPLHEILDLSVKCFIDEKDAGPVAMTPIYLLVGCSMPLWLHPCPCDLTDSAGFDLLPLMAGVISVGIGDTAASVVGSKFGKIKYKNSIKTVEGTIAGIVAMGLVLPFFVYFGLVHYTVPLLLKFLVAVTASSLVETFTDQVDNLVLPLITFALLSI